MEWYLNSKEPHFECYKGTILLCEVLILKAQTPRSVKKHKCKSSQQEQRTECSLRLHLCSEPHTRPQVTVPRPSLPSGRLPKRDRWF